MKGDNNMKDTLMKLLTVKSIVTFALIGATVYLAVTQSVTLSPEFFAGVVMAVITYYFTKKDDKGGTI